jgi:hypothetical protein
MCREDYALRFLIGTIHCSPRIHCSRC